MSVESIPPRVRTPHVAARQAIGELQRRTVPAGSDVTVRMRPCVFSFPGGAVSGVRSGKWKNRNGDSFTLVTILCEDTGGSDCSVDVLVNGSSLLTVTLGSGVDYAEYTAVFSIGPTDVIQVETTAAGGQTEVTVLVE